MIYCPVRKHLFPIFGGFTIWVHSVAMVCDNGFTICVWTLARLGCVLLLLFLRLGLGRPFWWWQLGVFGGLFQGDSSGGPGGDTALTLARVACRRGRPKEFRHPCQGRGEGRCENLQKAPLMLELMAKMKEIEYIRWQRDITGFLAIIR